MALQTEAEPAMADGKNNARSQMRNNSSIHPWKCLKHGQIFSKRHTMKCFKHALNFSNYKNTAIFIVSSLLYCLILDPWTTFKPKH